MSAASLGLITSRVFVKPLARLMAAHSNYYSTNADSVSKDTTLKPNKNLFSLYIKDNYAKFAKQHPELSSSDILRTMADSWKKIKKEEKSKAKSKENKPKRPANAYLMFKSHLKQTENYKDYQETARLWREMDIEAKNKYYELARQSYTKYRQDLNEYEENRKIKKKETSIPNKRLVVATEQPAITELIEYLSKTKMITPVKLQEETESIIEELNSNNEEEKDDVPFY